MNQVSNLERMHGSSKKSMPVSQSPGPLYAVGPAGWLMHQSTEAFINIITTLPPAA